MGQESSSRLQRLLTLLETGSSQATRFAAARQIGEISKSNLQDLNSLLRKVSHYLHSKSWDTRVAAAHAVGSISENVKHTSLCELVKNIRTDMLRSGVHASDESVISLLNFHSSFIVGSFRSFDMIKVLEFGALLASGGQEFDVVNDISKTPKERLAHQKRNLRRRLGLDVCEGFMDVGDIFKDEDLLPCKYGNGTGHVGYRSRSPHDIRKFVANALPGFLDKRPSSRELNLLKRKAKINSKGELNASFSDSSASSKGLSYGFLGSDKMRCFAAASPEISWEYGGTDQWPLNNFVDQLLLDIFDPVWEIRHGSAMALREILTSQGASAGIYTAESSSDTDSAVEESSKNDMGGMKFDESDEFDRKYKKPKLEDASHPQSNEMNSFAVGAANTKNLMKVGRDEKDASDPIPKIEEACPNNGAYTCDKTRLSTDSGDEDKISLCVTNEADGQKMDTLKHDSHLRNLVELTRSSWFRNCEILQDCAVRLLCVLSLDRFGDYVSDQVVAPVRETCAQSLGAVLKYMQPCLVYEVLDILLQMQHRPEWEIRHGSLLGIKYLVAVRKEMICGLLGFILPACKSGLGDPDDDVRAVAAEALIPAASFIVSLQRQQLHSIVMLLWDILLDLDDLSPSTSSVMNLLAEIYSHEDMITNSTNSTPNSNKKQVDLNESVFEDAQEEGKTGEENPYFLSTMAPRLWPFMRHSITSVRFSAIRTLERLLEAEYRRSAYGSLATSFWPSFILGDTLRIVFQNFLLESNDGILQCSERVWRLLLQCPVCDLEEAASSYISSWIELAATPYGSPFDTTKMYWPVTIPRKSHFRAAAKMKIVKFEGDEGGISTLATVKVASSHDANGGDMSSNPNKLVVGSDLDKSVTHTRVVTSSALGVFASKLRVESLRCVIDPLWINLTSLSGVQRQVSCMILVSWFREVKSGCIPDGSVAAPAFINEIRNWMLKLLSSTDTVLSRKESIPYSELTRTYYKMCIEANNLLQAAASCGGFRKILSSIKIDTEHMNVDEAINFASKFALKNCEDSVEKCIADDFESARQQLLTTAGYLKCVQNNLHVTVSALVAAAVVWISDLPAKLNPVILPLMASIKREQEEMIQQKSAEALAELICYCVPRKPGPNDKLIKNLCCLTCIDTGMKNSLDDMEDNDLINVVENKYDQKARVHLLPGGGEDRLKMEGIISRRGSELCLKSLCEKLGPTLFEKLPKLWECLTEHLLPFDCDCSYQANEIRFSLTIESVQDPQILISNIQVVRCITPLVDEALVPIVLNLLPCILLCVRHSITAVRLTASRCITSMAKVSTAKVMESVIERAIPMLEDALSVNARHGAGMLISYLVRGLGIELVSFSPLLVVPLLRCMSDCDTSVRKSVTHSFAALVPLLPLARGVSSPTDQGKSLSRNAEDALFLEQLLDNTHIEDYKVAIDLKITLRRYQQEGINWLAFLRRFKLHGILCDDMGLGKTLQATAIVATDIVEHRTLNGNEDPLTTLIICPTTLVAHWDYEIEKYIDSSIISPLQYVGSVQERLLLRASFDKHNVIITSYDVVRKDIDFLSEIPWNFCILDEGHIIKNAKSKITAAVKCLKSQHRLILSGTPIQNNILDLWSLLDFLMPGFLGSERQFQATYGKPLLASRDPKCSSKDAEAGALAVEALHKQVMPFLLRRTKDEVLSDLPEKIIQDRYCDLSPVQTKLYEQFSGFQAQKEISTLVGTDATNESGERSNKASSHVFQAIQYLLKLCSHPLLVMGDKLSDSLMRPVSEVLDPGADIIPELHRIQHSPKLVALQEILEECGVGVDPTCSETSVNVGQHRVLIFAQHKAFLDIIERDLFHAHMKNVTYLRVDGSVESERRFEIVKLFNSDPTIDVLLLTTHVGGLGLNLTSADTVVFMEHDWNPMRDHQAMDRAHRLGQRKVVNVHRLIMRGTLEEKVMSLQRFKLSVANSVINAENASLKTMNTNQLLDLFTPVVHSRNKAEKGCGLTEVETGRKKGMKGIVSGLSELWEQSQYTEEYDLTQFLDKLKRR